MEWLTEWLTENSISLITVIGTTAYGLWQRNIKEKLERSIRGDNWELFLKASQANGYTQLALKKYQEVHKDHEDVEIVSKLSKGDAIGQDVFKTTVRLIHKSETEFNSEAIEKWIKSGRVSPEYKPLFEIYLETKRL